MESLNRFLGDLVGNFDCTRRSFFIYLGLFVPSLTLIIWSNADWNAITGDTLLLLSSLQALERFSSIFSVSNANPLQGLFDVFPSGLRLDSIANLIGRAFFGPGVHVEFFYLFNGVFLTCSVVLMARTVGLHWKVALLAGFLLPLLILPTFGMFPLVEHIFLLWPLLYYSVACTILVLANFWLIDGRSWKKWGALTFLNAAIVLHLSIIQPLFMTLVAPAFIALGIGALVVSKERSAFFAKILSAATISMVLLAAGIFGYLHALGLDTAHYVFFSELSSFMLFGEPSWDVFWEDIQRVFLNPFSYEWPGGNSLDGIIAPIGQLGAFHLILFGSNHKARVFGWVVILWAIVTAITIGVLHFFYFYTELMYQGPDPRHFVRVLWPFYIICAASLLIYTADLFVGFVARIWPFARNRNQLVYHILITLVVLGPSVFIGTRHLILVAMPATVVGNQIFPTTLPTYSLKNNRVVSYLKDEVGIAIGREFRGSVLAMPTDFHRDIKPYGIWRRETTFAYARAYFGNDFGAYGLRDHNIPTLDQFSHNITPQFYLVSRELFSRPGIDRFDRHFATMTRLNEPILSLLGARYIIADHELPIGTQKLTMLLPDPGRELMKAQKLLKSPLRVYELDHPNVGNYSPTEIIRAKTARAIMSKLASLSFDGRKSVITNDLRVKEKLVPASNAKMIVQEGGVKIQAQSAGQSVLVLPVQFSHCWEIISGSDASLLRANLMQLGVRFSGNLKIELRQVFGPFWHSACRVEDAKDMEKLNVVDAVGVVADLAKEAGDGINLISHPDRLEKFIPSSAIASISPTQEPGEGARSYTLTAAGGRGEHYLGLSLPKIAPGTYTLSMQVRSDTLPRFAIQLLDGKNGALVKYLMPLRLFWVTELGDSDKLGAKVSNVDEKWHKLSLTATLRSPGGVVILQLVNRGGSRNFKPQGERIIIRKLKLERGEIATTVDQ